MLSLITPPGTSRRIQPIEAGRGLEPFDLLPSLRGIRDGDSRIPLDQRTLAARFGHRPSASRGERETLRPLPS